LDLSAVIPIFHRFLVTFLVTNDLNENSNLKENLGYASDYDTTPCYLEDEDWWNAHFPNDLKLAHAKSAYALLKSAFQFG